MVKVVFRTPRKHASANRLGSNISHIRYDLFTRSKTVTTYAGILKNSLDLFIITLLFFRKYKPFLKQIYFLMSGNHFQFFLILGNLNKSLGAMSGLQGGYITVDLFLANTRWNIKHYVRVHCDVAVSKSLATN